MLLPPGGAVLRPEVVLLDRQADSLLPFIRGRPRGPEGGQWSILDCDEDGQVGECCFVWMCRVWGVWPSVSQLYTSPLPRWILSKQVSRRVDTEADDDLAAAIQQLMRRLGSGTETATDGGGLHVLLAEDLGSGSGTVGALLDAARMTDASGRAVPAPPDMVPLLLAVNSAAGRLAAALAAEGRQGEGDGEDGGDGGDGGIGPSPLLLQVGCILEPSMLVGSGRRWRARTSSVAALDTNPPSPSAASPSMRSSGGASGYIHAMGERDRGCGLVLGVTRQHIGAQQQLIAGEGVQVREPAPLPPVSHCIDRLGCAVCGSTGQIPSLISPRLPLPLKHTKLIYDSFPAFRWALGRCWPRAARSCCARACRASSAVSAPSPAPRHRPLPAASSPVPAEEKEEEAGGGACSLSARRHASG